MTWYGRLGWTLLIMAWVGVPAAEAGLATSIAKEAAKRGTSSAARKSASSAPRVFAQDAAAHRRTLTTPLKQPRTVYRYTTRERARWERVHGVPPDRHMTARGVPGRPLSASQAQQRLGLPAKPEMRETIQLPKGQPLRHNKVHGGGPGQGELTSPKRLPPAAVKKVIPLR